VLQLDVTIRCAYNLIQIGAPLEMEALVVERKIEVRAMARGIGALWRHYSTGEVCSMRKRGPIGSIS